MKKKLAGVLAAMMVLAMGTTVFASQSPTSEATAEQKAQQLRDSVTSVDSSNSSVKVQFDKVDAAEVADANQKATSYSDDAEILGMVDLKSSQDFKKGVTLKFYVSGISKGDNVRILHKLANGTWEVIVPTVGDGYVKATFYSLSPIAIVKYPSDVSVPSSQKVNDDEDDNNDDSNNNNDNDSNTNNNSSDNNSTSGDTDNDSNSSSNSTSGDNSSNSSSNSSSKVTVNNYSNRSTSGAGSGTSPKTGQEVPVLPIVAVFALAGVAAICGRKLV